MIRNVNVKDIIFNDKIPKICVPITGTNENQILNDIVSLNNVDFDLIELRLDFLENPNDSTKVLSLLSKIKQLYFKPLLFTFRTKKEGGMCQISEGNYFELIYSAIGSGLVDLIDIELFSNEDEIKKIISFAKDNQVKVIMSNHDFNKTPIKEEIIQRLVKMQELDADITKIAVMPNSEEDVLTLMAAALEMKKEKGDRPFVAISMGTLGVITRLTGGLLGSCLTFAALNNKSAPGQLSIEDTRFIINKLKY